MAVGGILISMISSIPSELSLSDPFLVPEVTFAGMVATYFLEGVPSGAGVAVMPVGFTPMGVRDEGTGGCLFLRNCGIFDQMLRWNNCYGRFRHSPFPFFPWKNLPLNYLHINIGCILNDGTCMNKFIF